MAIFDISGNHITPNNYNNLDEIVNIEFGSGKGYFGKREYPECYLTDQKIPDLQHFMECLPDYHNSDCHYIDFACDFYHHNFNGRLFQKIVLCNPYEFGYIGLSEAKIFFNRAGDLLDNNGQIIICSKSNPFVKKRKLVDYLGCNISSFQSKYKFIMQEFEEMNETHRIRQDYRFKYSCLIKDATPDQKITIKKISN